jgi:alkylmercury lyase
MGELGEVLAGEIRGAAFRRLLRTGSPVRVEQLAADLCRSVEEIVQRVDELSRRGRIRLDEEGKVAGSAGLSVRPDRHRIEIGGRTFWTWCAYDVVGIFGALRASGEAHSTSPAGGGAIEVHFKGGQPLPSAAVLFRPDDGYLRCCDNVYEEWCPNSNFFEDEGAARTWSNDRGLSGRVLTLHEATELGARDWESVARGLSN